MIKRIRTTKQARDIRNGINTGIHLYAIHDKLEAAIMLELNFVCGPQTHLPRSGLMAARRTWARLVLGISRGR